MADKKKFYHRLHRRVGTVSYTVLQNLRLLQLADSALPIGGMAHSFGMESLIEEGFLAVDDLYAYLETVLEESLLLDAVYCGAGHQSHRSLADLNARFSAIRQGRESREASLALGKRFLRLAGSLDSSVEVQEEDLHFCIAFGSVCGSLSFERNATVGAYLHQAVGNAISAAQRLLPLGQMQASRIAWDLKPVIEASVRRSAELDIERLPNFSHLPELASMRHPMLHTRLFMS